MIFVDCTKVLLMIKLLFVSLLIFCYISLIKPILLGFPIAYLLVPFGVLLFLIDTLNNKFNIRSDFFKMFLILFFIVFFFMISIFINQTGDSYYIKEVFQFNIFAFFSAYFIVRYYINNFDSDINKFVLIFSNVVFFQLIISFIALINPIFFNFIFSIIDSTILFEDALESFSDFRMVVIGTPFFGSAIINCFTLALIAAYYPTSKYKKLSLFLWVSIATLGMVSARTTIVGIIISLIIYLIQFYKFRSNIILYLFVLTTLLLFILPNIKLSEQFSNIQNFAFDFLLNFKDSKASDSTGDLLQMYQIIPKNLQTWLIGDGFFKDGDGLYYKGIDIGYLRIIFANGLLGLFMYLLLNFFIINKSKIPYSFLVFSIVLILNFKGFTNMIYLILLFFIFKNISHKKNAGVYV